MSFLLTKFFLIRKKNGIASIIEQTIGLRGEIKLIKIDKNDTKIDP